MKKIIYLLVSFLLVGLQELKAAEYPLTIFCSDDVQKKELYVYQSIFADTPSKVKIRDLNIGKNVEQSSFLTISAEMSNIIIWPRANNHGGAAAIFTASLENGLLIGNGFGLKNARCFYLGL